MACGVSLLARPSDALGPGASCCGDTLRSAAARGKHAASLAVNARPQWHSPGTLTRRALSAAGNGDASVAPSGAGIHEVDVKVA